MRSTEYLLVMCVNHLTFQDCHHILCMPCCFIDNGHAIVTIQLSILIGLRMNGMSSKLTLF